MNFGISPYIAMNQALSTKIQMDDNNPEKRKAVEKKNSFPVIEIFHTLGYRNKIIVIVTNNDDIIDTYINKFKEGSGVIAEKATIYDPSLKQNGLRHACRALASSILVNRTKILLIKNNDKALRIDEATKIAAAFSASLIWLSDMSIKDAVEQMEELNRMLPKKMQHSMSSFTSVGAIYQQSGHDAISSYNSLRQYTKYQRNLIVAFGALLNGCYYRFRSGSTLDVVGYNPEYVEAALLHNTQIKFIDIGEHDNNNILPKLKDYSKNVKSTDEWNLPDSQRKLNQIDSLMLSLGTNIIYIGSYPCTHLKHYNLSKWNIVFIDPKIDQENMNMLLDVCPKAHFEAQEFVFNTQFLESLIYTYKIEGDIIIIDDSYNDMSMSYSNFQEVKLSFFEEITSSKFHEEHKYMVKYVSMKCNIRSNKVMDNVIALLPQPLGGDLDEMRLILGAGGIRYEYEYQKKIVPYMKQFKALKLEDRLSMIKYYHNLMTERKDALKYVPDSNVVLALYSITNTTNSIEDLRKYLIKMHAARKTVILNVPYAGRIQYMLNNKFKPGLDIKLRDNKVTFHSPSKKVWSDHCLTNSDLLDMGYIQITPEMISGLLGTCYKGPGFLDNSAYSDLFNLYIPSFILDTFFRFQHIGTGPIASVKSVTSCIRNIQPCMARGEYYKLRGKLVEDFLLENHVPAHSYILIGTEQCAIRIIQDIQIDTVYGCVLIKASISKPVDINISGHLLSLTISSHFIPIALDAWVTQLRTMAQSKNVAFVMQYLSVSNILMFDNKTDDTGEVFLPWHTMEELILTLCILEKYVALIMRNNYSPTIISDVKKSFIKMASLSV